MCNEQCPINLEYKIIDKMNDKVIGAEKLYLASKIASTGPGID